MKISFTLFTLAIVSLVCAPFGICADPPENIVMNGDFESLTQNWDFWTEPDAIAEWHVLNKKVDPIDGDNVAYVKVTKGGAAWNCIQFYQGGLTLNIKKYTLCVWGKSNVDRRPVFLAVHHHEDPWTMYGSINIALETSWKEYTLTFNQPVADNNARVNIGLGGSMGDVWVDHVRLYEGVYFNDEVRKPSKQAVGLQGKLTTTWGNIKAQ